MFKKKFFALVLAFLLLPAVCSAEFTVNSDSRTFNMLTGVYDLVGNVTVQFPAQGSDMTIKGDRAIVQMWQQELHGNGNVKLDWNGLAFTCDKVDVYQKERTAYLAGNLVFNHNGNHITSNSGSYCWKTKLAVFEGNVVVNGAAQSGSYTYSFKQ